MSEKTYYEGFRAGREAAESACEQKIQRLVKQIEQKFSEGYESGVNDGYETGVNDGYEAGAAAVREAVLNEYKKVMEDIKKGDK